MWTAAGQQVAEKMSPAAATDVGTVAMIIMFGLLAPERSSVTTSNCCCVRDNGHSLRLRRSRRG